MKRKALFLFLAIAYSQAYAKNTPSENNCSCTDQVRNSTIHNNIMFDASQSTCNSFGTAAANIIKLSTTLKGQGKCQVNGSGATYDCSYSFTKMHPTSCSTTTGDNK